jgi:cytochrome c-type biogenesis protein CcmH/NrfG
MDGNPEKAARAARDGIGKGYRNPKLLTMLAESLVRAGARPGDAEFAEAQKALEEVISTRPRDAGARISLGKLYLLSNRVHEAVAELEGARDLDPRSPAVYSSLAKAYRMNGDSQRSQEALNALEKFNQQEADRIASAPGDSRANYAGAAPSSNRR